MIVPNRDSGKRKRNFQGKMGLKRKRDRRGTQAGAKGRPMVEQPDLEQWREAIRKFRQEATKGFPERGFFPSSSGAQDEEERLQILLGRLPSVRLSSHFTQQVLDRIQCLEPASQPRSTPVSFWREVLERWWAQWQTLLRRPAWIGTVILVCALGLWLGHQVQQHHQKEQLVQALQTVGPIVSVPTVEMLRDFDYIYALPDEPPEDLDALTKALQ